MAGPGRGPIFEPRSFPSREKSERFDEALDFAERAANAAGPIFLRIGLASRMNKRTAQVSLPEVVAFFVVVDWPDIPPPLLALVSSRAAIAPAEAEGTAAAVTAATQAAPVEKKGQGLEWTPERLAELKTYRAQHGTKAAGEKYGITDTRIRALLPGDKPQQQGYSAFTQRPK